MSVKHQQLVVTATSTPFLSYNGSTFERETQLLFGEQASLLEEAGEYYHVLSERYSTPGYVRKSAVRLLARGHLAPYTHRVAVVCAPVYERANFKTPKLDDTMLTLNARIRCTAHTSTPEGDMSFVEGLGWIFSNQIIQRDEYLSDHVETARLYVGNSYVWGGHDCSRIIEQACVAANIPCLRNVGEQSTSLGVAVDMKADDFAYRRGDFVFWTSIPKKSRHVVLMIDWHTCVHATIALPRQVVEQPLKDVIAQQCKDGNGEPNIVRRFPNRR